MQTRVLSCLLALGFLSACNYGNGDPAYVLGNSPDCGAQTASTIDTGARMVVDAGIGAGAFVEYAEGGHFHVRTACDTVNSNSTCYWDLLLTSTAGISNVAPESFEPSDSATSIGADSLRMVTTTDTDLDGVTFDVVPGDALKVDALLDGYCAPSFIFWIGGGGVHSAPTSVVWLTPSSP
jgi:hypothetical protein